MESQFKKVVSSLDTACLAIDKSSGWDAKLKSPIMHPQSQKAIPKIAIFLCTYQGQNHLVEQLESIAAQSHSNWEVWASDDGSQDNTHVILKSYQDKWGAGRLSIHMGPAAGFAANFLSLTCNLDIEADYFAYSDQDDIWESDRLSRAIEWLETVYLATPALYSSRTRYISEDGSEVGFSCLFKKPPQFRNALVQSIAGGNTMVFNGAARDLLAKSPAHIKVVSHDWWIYLLVSGCGGRVFYDSYPGVRYRQHCNNLAGQNVTLLARLFRVKGLLLGRFKDWNEINLKALNEVQHLLTSENRVVLAYFNNARRGNFFSRIINLHRSGIYRQTTSGNVGVFIASLLNKL